MNSGVPGLIGTVYLPRSIEGFLAGVEVVGGVCKH